MSVEPKRVRAPIVRIVDRRDETTVLGKVARRFDGASAGLLRALLEIHGRPVSRTDVMARLAELADDGVVPEAPVDQLIALLVEDGVLVAATPIVRIPATRRVVLCVTGAVAAVDAPLLVRGLMGSGCIVRVAMTRTAQRFVSAMGLEAIAHQPVARALWSSNVPHVELAEWAELVVVSPCSATTLARIAHGDCSDLVSAIATATRAPIVIVPSMNDAMYGSPAVQDNLATLRAHGRWLVHPALGVEVAHRPDERTPVLGPSPPPHVIVEIVRHALVQIVSPVPPVPSDAAGWERAYALPLAHLPWHSDELDAAIAALLSGRAGTLLDLGTGAGTIAIAAARLGFDVTATDLAPSALGHARTRAGDLPILFALDDVLASRLRGTFETIVDRGLLHCLPIDARPRYAAQISRWGGMLIVVAHAPGAELGTHAVTEAELAQLFPGRAIGAVATTLSGRAAHAFTVV